VDNVSAVPPGASVDDDIDGRVLLSELLPVDGGRERGRKSSILGRVTLVSL